MTKNELNNERSDRIIFLLFLIGISVLFIASSIAFLYIRVNSGLPPVELPNLFILSTIAVVFSGYFLHQSHAAIVISDYPASKKYFYLTLVLSAVFLLAQYFTCADLIAKERFISNNQSLGFLYFLFGLHFFHFILGIPFLLSLGRKLGFFSKTGKTGYEEGDEARLKSRLKLLVKYWHFMEVLWIYLILLFFLHDFL